MVKQKLASFLFVIVMSIQVSGQESITISGFISDSISAENLYNATIFENNSSYGTISNAYGFYSLSVPPGILNLRISFVGYQPQQLSLTTNKDTTINFTLSSKNDLQEIKVSAKGTKKRYTFAGNEFINMQTIKALPAFAGEQDVLKSLSILPGVQQGYEGSTGIFVRGGSPDQNLILLDGVPIFNAAHLFGFVSVFTPEALQNVDFYKSGFPARYGGRLSSVIDVRMREGNRTKRKTNLTFGLLSSKITHEGPIKKGKSSYLISARRTLLDLLVTGIGKINQKYSDESIVPGLNFYDINTKFNFDINKKNRLYLSFYAGGDQLFSTYYENEFYQEITSEQKSKFSLKWGNIIGALRWNRQIGNKIFLNTTLSTGMFQYKIHNNYKQVKTENNISEEQWTDILYKTYVNNNKLKFLFDWYQNSTHKIQFGSDVQMNWFIPGQQKSIYNEGAPINRGNKTTSNYIMSIFADDRISISEKLTLYGGFRVERHKMPNKHIGFFLPRISIKISPSTLYNFNLSYDETAQALHLLSNSSIGFPSDIWVPATKNVPPEFSRQFTLGANITLNNNIQYKLDSYFKKIKRVINYKAGQSFINIYDNWEEQIEIGDGEAYGFENSLCYKTSQLNTWINYTLSWNNRKFNSINNGKMFPYKFDRRHDINLGCIFRLTEHIECSAVWTYQTGQATTIPTQDYQAAEPIDYWITDLITNIDITDTHRIQYFKEYNNYRLPAFHHLDLSITFKNLTEKSNSEWKIGIYNAYARQNPYMYYPQNSIDNQTTYKQTDQIGYKQVCIFPIIPSVSYKMKF